MPKVIPDPATSLRFHVVIGDISEAAFSECSGLQAEIQIESYVEGVTLNALGITEAALALRLGDSAGGHGPNLGGRVVRIAWGGDSSMHPGAWESSSLQSEQGWSSVNSYEGAQ